MFSIHSSRDLNREYQARVNAALQKRRIRPHVPWSPAVAQWQRLRAWRFALRLQRAQHPQQIDSIS